MAKSSCKFAAAFMLMLPIFAWSKEPLPWWSEVEAVAHQFRLPATLLYALCQQESNYQYAGGRTGPYPFVLNVNGKATYYSAKADAEAALNRALAEGKRNIDIGMCQLNYRWQSSRLNGQDASVWLDPQANLYTAAVILDELWRSTNNLATAVGYYHSRTASHSTRHKTLVAKKLKSVRKALINTDTGEQGE